MPLQGRHACELRPMSQFQNGSIRTMKRNHDGKEYNVLIGKLKGEAVTTEHSYHYKTDVWDAGSARNHCRSHDGKFEAAAKESKNMEPEIEDLPDVNMIVGRTEAEKPKEIERRYVQTTEFRVDEDERTIEGYAAVFNRWSGKLGSFREKIKQGAFKKSINENDIRSLFNHDPNYILGRTKNKTLQLWEDEKGLNYRVNLPETTYARDLIESIKRKDISQNSFGFQVVQDEWNKDMSQRELLEARLFDVGPVTFPAYPQTTVSIRSMVYDIGIDYDEFINVLIKQKRGVDLDKGDRSILYSAIDILNNFVSDEEPRNQYHSDESGPATDHPQEPGTDSHLEDAAKPSYNPDTLRKSRLLKLQLNKWR